MGRPSIVDSSGGVFGTIYIWQSVGKDQYLN